MKGTLIALDTWNGRKAAARVVDGLLDDLIVDPAEASTPRPGAIYRAVADRPMKGQGGTTVKLPGRLRGFLRDTKGAGPGKPLLVQVTGVVETGKAVPVTSKLLFKGRYVLVTPSAPGINLSRRIRDEAERQRLLDAVAGSPAHGMIIRSEAEGQPADHIAEDAAAMLAQAESVLSRTAGEPAQIRPGHDAHDLARRDWPSDGQTEDTAGCFTARGIDDLVAEIISPKLSLAAGATAWIEPTRALVAVDVNTGSDTSPAAGLKANLALAKDLPRQLRCRGLGGQITIDLAPFPKSQRKQFETTLRSAFRRDNIETALVGWTPLGHFELQRKRERFPIL